MTSSSGLSHGDGAPLSISPRQIRSAMPEQVGFTLIQGDADQVLGPLQVDSRHVVGGDCFVVLPPLVGGRDPSPSSSHTFVAQALERGAAALILQRGTSDLNVDGYPPHVTIMVVNDGRLALAYLARLLYPGVPRRLVGVTGTSGKSSVATFARQLFAGGACAASIGTLGVEISRPVAGDGPPVHASFAPLSLTSPGALEVHRLLHTLAATEGVDVAVLEVSSHALDQHRLDGVPFQGGAFTNLSQDHLDYHQTMDRYFAAKKRFFDQVLPPHAPRVIWMGDGYAQGLADHMEQDRRPCILCGVGGAYDIGLIDWQMTYGGSWLTIQIMGETHRVFFPVFGVFQIHNLLVAVGLCIAAGEKVADLLARIPTLRGVPGRLEYVGETPGGGAVFVDYAHKPGALEQVLTSLKPSVQGQLWTVFGCGGDRDTGKRPLMGAIAARYSDHVVITDDNPRTEDPGAIRSAIVAGMGTDESLYTVIGDRRAAIAFALERLKQGDVCVVAGKGHESGQIVGNHVLPFHDRHVIEQILHGLQQGHEKR